MAHHDRSVRRPELAPTGGDVYFCATSASTIRWNTLIGWALGALAAISVSAYAHAQVMEISGDGVVRTYDGPAVFTDAGVAAIYRTHNKPIPTGGRRILRAREGFGAEKLARAAGTVGISPALVEAVAWRESNFQVDRVSRAGAVGEMQLMPRTARDLGVDPADPIQNLRGGAGYLDRLMRRYDGDLVRALAAYNAGPRAVDRYRGVPPYKETRAYVAAVLDRLSQAVVPAGAQPAGQGPAS